MASIIGRQEDLQKISRFYQSAKAEFMAVYGRRRVGKTFLIQSHFSSISCVFFHVTGLKDGTLQDQIENFTRVIGKTLYQGAPLKVENTWLNVFSQLTDAMALVPKNEKIVLFFDELPWMATKRSKLIQALDHYWNRYWSIDPRVKLIVCGSSASWILEKLIHNKAGLYNRITYQMALEPFTLKESKAFLAMKDIRLNHSHLLKLYMVMGGIPLYLDQIEKGRSADQNIESICFSKSGLLFSEFKKLFASLFENHEICEALIRIISENRYGISQANLMKKSDKKTGGRLKKRLQELEDAGFIESFVPYLHKERGIYYRIIDEYSIFYLRWIEPILNSIKRKEKESGYWLSKQKSAAWDAWQGYAFEAICYKHISQIRKGLKIGVGAEISTWRYAPKKGTEDQGAQIDLLFDRDDDTITLCEIKCTSKPFILDKASAKNLLNKVKVFQEHTRTSKQIFIALVSANGLQSTMYSDDLVSDVVTLEALFD